MMKRDVGGSKGEGPNPRPSQLNSLPPTSVVVALSYPSPPSSNSKNK